jgi:hypothetical protein
LEQRQKSLPFWSDEWSEFIGKGLIQLFWFDHNSITQKTNQTTNNLTNRTAASGIGLS